MDRPKRDAPQRLLTLLRQKCREDKRPPTIRELMLALGFQSPRAVTYWLERLEKRGLVCRDGKSRGWRPVEFIQDDEAEESKNRFSIPMFENIPAGHADGTPPEAAAPLVIDQKFFKITDPARCFAVRVRGVSMTGAGILDGDLAILEQRPAKAGDVVAALIDGETTLKRLVAEKGSFYLRAEHPDYPDLRPKEGLEIQGVVVGIIRGPRG